MMKLCPRASFLLLLLAGLSSSFCSSYAQELQCSLKADDAEERDPALQEMQYDVGDGPQTTLVYVEPKVETFYPPGEAPSKHEGGAQV